MINAIVLISGSGSNLASLVEAQTQCGITINAVISNKCDAYGLVRAKESGITDICIASKNLEREEFEHVLAQEIDTYAPDLIILAGFMRILTSDFVSRYEGKMLNIHPSLLPKFKGLDTHKRALEAGEKYHGATVHLVSPELDSGEIILQDSLIILESDTAQSLAARVLQLEHVLYPKAVQKFVAQHL